jgi:tetratricopeptide (TPR) repeat protein
MSVVVNLDLAQVFWASRQYDQAIAQGRKALEFDPASASAHASLAMSYLEDSMYKEGIAETKGALKDEPGDPRLLAVLRYACGVEPCKADARQVLDGVRAVSKQKYGHEDKAFELPREMSDERRLVDPNPE